MQLRPLDLTWQSAGDDLIILDLRNSMYLKLNGTGHFLWNQLESDCSEVDLIEALTEEYGITTEQAAADVTTFVNRLTERDLLDADA